jgi:hypothetical protein
LVLLVLLALSLIWLGYSADPKVTAVRHTLHYKAITAMGGPTWRSDRPPGTVSGMVQDAQGEPLSGATVLVASPLGHTYRAETNAAGEYRISDVPPGRYVPIAGKRDYEDALDQTCLLGMCFKRFALVRSDRDSEGVDLTVHPLDRREIVLDDSLVVSPTVGVAVGAPFPSQALRTHLTFERASLRVNDCWLYEPRQEDGSPSPTESLPTLLLVLPGPVMNWEIVPIPFAAQGFSVLACYPLRGIEIDEDVVDLLTALEYLRRGRIPSRADTERLGLIGASFSSIHAYRFLRLTDKVDVVLVLGGMSDGFAFRHDVEVGIVQTRPPFDQILASLGFPNSSPELYFRYSSIHHLEGMPPFCLLHGIEDELSPFSQSVRLANELERVGHPHRFYSYEGLKHYFSTSADNATTQQMFQDSLGCLRDYLE